MNWNELAESVDQWHDHQTAPLEGTPLLIDQGVALGVYAWKRFTKQISCGLLA